MSIRRKYRVDYHSHILPKMDDGSRSVEMTKRMLEKMRAQGIEKVVATPHYYAHRGESVESFLARRKDAYRDVKEAIEKEGNEDGGRYPKIILGAEVAIEQGLSEIEEVERLRIEGSEYILLEPPYYGYRRWVKEEIEELANGRGLKPIIAHIHRYAGYYAKEEIEDLLEEEWIYQINNEAYDIHREKKLVKELIKRGYRYIFGSDSHNIDSRAPNWEILYKKAKEGEIEEAEELI